MPAPAYSIAPKLAHNATIRVGRGESPDWTKITGLQNVEWPDRMPSDLDITNQDSPGFAEENMPGILPAVDYAIDHLLDDGSAGDTALTELAERDPVTALKELHLVEIGVGGKTVTCMGYVKEYKPVGQLKGVVMMRTTWRLMATVANAAAGGGA
ncbi:hypothetical protein JI664_03540 [Rhodobacter sp. NTK016B]|uniref:hypothetical protein n=1 Tax=Rhodobacter sp. NTK016B TaxID=2759676 RepID=UPI001A8E5951|nr:hypothetical protein [Rhodobacter sp. NTK016B]MBN8291030.1 hypothetical protein [Rhodobacter sp. NTK016B]